MHALPTVELLAVWEQVQSLPACERPAAVLAAGLGEPVEQCAALPVGWRDVLLLRWHATVFGDRLDGHGQCPACATPVEFSIGSWELLAGAHPPGEPAPICLDGYSVHWRVPDSHDMVAVASCPDVDTAQRLLLVRCVHRAESPTGPVEAAALPPPLRETLAEKMAKADPYAEIVFTLCCPGCDTIWQAWLEVTAFVCSALREHAQRLLAEVDELARTYGWSERDILGLSPARRAAYLGLVRGG